MYVPKERRYTTDMTVVVAERYNKGIVIKSDSLALVYDSHDTEQKIVDITERDKLIQINDYVILGIAASNLYEIVESFIVNAFQSILANNSDKTLDISVERLRSFLEVMKIAFRGKGIYIELIIAGCHNNATNTQFDIYTFSISEREVELAAHDRNAAIGSREATRQSLEFLDTKRKTIEATNRYDAEQYTHFVIRQCSEVEKKAVEAKELSPVHVGGKVQAWHITNNGVFEQHSDERLPIYVTVS